jgi:tetratricopeptide (TPR) repeat protein
MTTGRWSGQTRGAVVLAGLVLVVLGVLTTIEYHSEAGSAALVLGGLLVGLAGVSGGAIVVRATEPEGRIASAGQAQQAGDAEGAYDRFVHLLRAYAPKAIEYHESATTALYDAAGREGQRLQPIFGYFLGPIAMSGSLIVVDIRAGTGFSLQRMQATYQGLLVGHTAAFEAALVIVNAAPDEAILTSVYQLSTALDRPVVPVAWRLGDPSDAISEGIARIKHELALRAPAPVHVPVSSPPASPPPVAPTVQPPAPVPNKTPAPRRAPQLFDDAAAWQRATDLHWRGQLQEAEEAYRAIVDARGQALGWDHPDTLTARDQHATVLRDLDRLAEALVECDEALTARVRLLGQDHPDTLTSRSHLATIYHQLGDLSRAEAEHQHVLDSRTRVLGANHQETLISRSNLAKVYQDMGELDRAIDEHHTVLLARSRLLGPEHRDTLMSRSLLASALHHAGRLIEAEGEHRTVLASRLRLLGPVHLDTAVSRHRLGSVLHDLGRLDEAIGEYRAAQSVYAQLLGAGSPFARAAASDLAMAERAMRGAPSGRHAI